jgi:hypothetical protein
MYLSVPITVLALLSEVSFAKPMDTPRAALSGLSSSSFPHAQVIAAIMAHAGARQHSRAPNDALPAEASNSRTEVGNFHSLLVGGEQQVLQLDVPATPQPRSSASTGDAPTQPSVQRHASQQRPLAPLN